MVRLGPSRFGVELQSRQVTNALHVCRSPCQKKSEVTVDNPGFEVGRKEGDDEGTERGETGSRKGALSGQV
jgi:hypothetical protein